MHTTTIKNPEDDGARVIFIHNADLSGEVTIRQLNSSDVVVNETKLPGYALLDFCRATIAGEMISVLEQRFA